MYCPNCGQQQVSNEIKYCSRCGFQMGLIPELLANGGVLPQLMHAMGKKKFWTKKNGVMLSVLWLLFCWFLMAPLFAITGAEEGAAFFGALGFFGIIFGVVVSLFFLPSSRTDMLHTQMYQPQTGSLPNPNYVPGALPPQQSIPAQDYVQPGHWKAPDTGQFAQPGSVTDSTTKLLERDTE